MLAALLASVSVSAPAIACEAVHVVRPGESLSVIAERHYGSMQAYRQIFRANLEVIGSNPDLIHIGMELRLPCADGALPEIDLREAKVQTEVTRSSPAGIRFELPSHGLRAAAKTSGVIVSAEMLNDAIATKAGGPQIIDLADGHGAGTQLIEGSVSLPFPSWGPAAENGAELDALLASAEIDPTQPIVLVPRDDSYAGMGAAARIYWLLRDAGARDVALLDTKRSDWSGEGLPLTRLVRMPLGLPEPSSSPMLIGAAPGEESDSITVVEASILDAEAQSETDGKADVLPLSDLAVATVGNFKSLDLPWGHVPVHIEARDANIAALAWFLLAEVAGIEEVHLLAPAADGTLLSARDRAERDGSGKARGPQLIPGAFSLARETSQEPHGSDEVPPIAALDSQPPSPDALTVNRPSLRNEPATLSGLGLEQPGSAVFGSEISVGASAEPAVTHAVPDAYMMNMNPAPPSTGGAKRPPGLLTVPPSLPRSAVSSNGG